MNNIYNVINEIIDHETYKKHVKPTIDTQSSEYKSQLKKILKTFFTEKGDKMPKRNLTIPYNSLKVTTLKNIDKQVINYLNDNEFQCNKESYEIGMCTNAKNKQVSIYNVLKQINDYDVEKLKTQLNEVDNDNAKEAIQKKIKQKESFNERYLTHYSRINKMMNRVIVFTWVPRKIASQSTKVSWKSCMTLFNGEFREFVPTGIETGQFIAYLVTKGDENKLDKPMARLVIKPFITEEGTLFWYPQSKVYPPKGNEPGVNESFKKKVEKFVKDRQDLDFSYDELVGATRLYDGEKQYNDFDTEGILKDKFSEQKQTIIDQINKKIDDEEEITIEDITDLIRAKVDYNTIKKALDEIEDISEDQANYLTMIEALKNDYPEIVNKMIKELGVDRINSPLEIANQAKRQEYNQLAKKIRNLAKKDFIEKMKKRKFFRSFNLMDAIGFRVHVDLIKRMIKNSDMELEDIYKALQYAKEFKQKNTFNFISQYYTQKVKENNQKKQDFSAQDVLDIVRADVDVDFFEKVMKKINTDSLNFGMLMEEAVKNSNKEIFIKLTQYEKSKEELKDITGYEILNNALKNDKEIAKEIIKNDYIDFKSLDKTDEDFANILGPIFKKNYIDILEMLFNKKEINLTLENNVVINTLMEKGSLKAFKMFLDYEGEENLDKNEILIYAIQNDRNKIANFMLEKVSSIDSTEIFYAATARNFKILKVLLQDKRLKKLDKEIITNLQNLIGKDETNELIQNYFHGNIEESFSYSINDINFHLF